MPEKIYYVLIMPGGTPLKYGQKGGGIYTREQEALNCVERLKRHGSKVRLFSTCTNWYEHEL